MTVQVWGYSRRCLGAIFKKGIQKDVRERVIGKLAEWGGELVEIRYTEGISTKNYQNALKDIGITPDVRRKKLARLLNVKNLVRVLEVHNALSGLIVENAEFQDRDKTYTFDAMWASSLTESTIKGKPDIVKAAEDAIIDNMSG